MAKTKIPRLLNITTTLPSNRLPDRPAGSRSKYRDLLDQVRELKPDEGFEIDCTGTSPQHVLKRVGHEIWLHKAAPAGCRVRRYVSRNNTVVVKCEKK